MDLDELFPSPRKSWGEGADTRRSLVVAVNGSEASLRATAYALGHARRQDMVLVGVYVRYASPIVCFAPTATDSIRQANDACVAEVHAYVTQQADALGVPHRFLDLCGSPAHKLCEVTDLLRADALVLGATEQRGIWSLRVGRTLPARLAQMCHCPLIIVP